MKDICINCGVEMKVGQVGVTVIEMYQDPPVPYTVTPADTRVCPGCGHEIVCPTTCGHTAHHFEEAFAEALNNALIREAKGKGRIIRVYERARRQN